uniref:Uncharacterized protein n=1 Tax=Anguilla anguilla TaxID=7936 RepID=A0A0E9S6T7_ANGAN
MTEPERSCQRLESTGLRATNDSHANDITLLCGRVLVVMRVIETAANIE